MADDPQKEIDAHLEGIFLLLANPFSSDEIRVRPQGGRNLQYVTARHVMNRLDEAVGWQNWWDDYEVKDNSIICKLSIRLPDGTILTKSDAGGKAGMADSGDDDKSGVSDAFKRAAVKFGVGRHLYGDGLPGFVVTGLNLSDEAVSVNAAKPSNSPRQSTSAQAPRQANPKTGQENGYPGAERGKSPTNGDRKFDPNQCPKSGRGLFAWAMGRQDQGTKGVVDALNDIGKQMSFPDKMKDWSEDEVREAWDAYHGAPAQ